MDFLFKTTKTSNLANISIKLAPAFALVVWSLAILNWTSFKFAPDDPYWEFTDEIHSVEAMRHYGDGVLMGLMAKNANIHANYLLAQMHYVGKGVEEDWPKSRYYADAAASAGYAPSQYALAHMLLRGHGGAVDINGARKWFAEAAANRNYRAQVVMDIFESHDQRRRTVWACVLVWLLIVVYAYCFSFGYGKIIVDKLKEKIGKKRL